MNKLNKGEILQGVPTLIHLKLTASFTSTVGQHQTAERPLFLTPYYA